MRLPLSLVLLLAIARAAAGETVQVGTDPASGILIQIETPLDVRSGHAPLVVEIRNDSGRERSWTFEFTSYSGTGTTRRVRSVLSVPTGEARTFDLTVPFATRDAPPSYLQVEVRGYGASASVPYFLGSSGYDPATEFRLASSRSLVESSAPSKGMIFAPEELPSDWRAFLAFRTIVVSEEDWRRIAPGPRTALLEWTAAGGRLLRVGGEESAASRYGLGTVAQVVRPVSEEEWGSVLEGPGRAQSISYEVWAKESVGPIETRSGLLLLFLVGYGVLIGPVNLYVLSPSGKRARLFWTMPTIALTASLFLALLIVLQDGVGGHGRRTSFVRLVPELTREVVIQEQVSRTGALLARSFELPERVSLFDAPTSIYATGNLASEESTHTGSWFRSRAVQAQLLEAVRPTRARLESAGEGKILSSLEEPLEELFYRDEEGRPFRASNVAPGASVSLEPVAEADYEAFWRELSKEAGPEVRARLFEVYWERGGFLGLASTGGASSAIETLPGIDWRDTRIVSGRLLGVS